MARAIRAAVNPGKGEPPVIEDLLLDDPLPDEMVVEMGATGICHTDLGIAGWLQEPRVLGHEGAGTVVAVGAEVTRFAIGDRVVATFGFCGACRNCRDDHPAYCRDHAELNIMGTEREGGSPVRRPDGTPVAAEFFQQSSFATHMVVTERNAVAIPDALSFVAAAPLGCGIQTGAGAVVNSLRAQAGKPLLVIGCGAVGLSGVMAARIVGCDPIVAVDLDQGRLAVARKLGAAHALPADTDDLAARIKELTDGGVSYALDAAGKQATYETALAACYPGGNVAVVNAPGEYGQPVPHPGGIAFVNTTTTGVIEGDSVPDRFIPWLIERHLAGELPYTDFVRTYRFEDIGTALSDAAAGRVVKPVLTFA